QNPQTAAPMNLPAHLPLPDGYSMRPWGEHDVEAVAQLDALVFGPDSWSHEIFSYEYQASMDQSPHSFYQVITHYDVVVGFAGLLYGPPFADVTTIGVHPDHTGKKLGAALLVWLMRTADALGAMDILLEAGAVSTAPHRLYAQICVHQSPASPGYYPGCPDAWVMRKRLREAGPSTAAALMDKE